MELKERQAKYNFIRNQILYYEGIISYGFNPEQIISLTGFSIESLHNKVDDLYLELDKLKRPDIEVQYPLTIREALEYKEYMSELESTVYDRNLPHEFKQPFHLIYKYKIILK